MAESRKLATSLFERLAPVMLVVIIGLAFSVGVLWQKVENLGKTTTTQVADTTTTTTAQGATPAPVSIDQVKSFFTDGYMFFGDANRDVLFVEIADPSCPYCSIAAGKNPELNKQASSGQSDFTLVADGGDYVAPAVEIKKLVDEGKAGFVYLYFPGHGNGEMGTKALYCAYEEGKFWEAHDLLMSAKGYEILNGVNNQNQPATGVVVKNDKTKSGELADFLKTAVSPAAMKSCLDSGKYDKVLSRDTETARELGVNGTPGFFVNTTRFPGAFNFTDMQSAVNEALN